MKFDHTLWIQECLKELKFPKNASALDLACGNGRNSIFLANLGFNVIAVDNNEYFLKSFNHVNVLKLLIDVEEKKNWPLSNEKFDIIVTVNFLNRLIFPEIINSIKKDGFLIYETFSKGQENLGRPKRKEFILKERELLFLTKSLELICYENVKTFSQNIQYIKQRVLCKNV